MSFPILSHFLGLPAELRHRIYEYALTEGSGVLCKVYRHPIARLFLYTLQGDGNEVIKREANQLKYVCRMLYDETKGLSLAFNDITLAASQEVKKFERFVQACAPGWNKWIRKIDIIWRKSFSEPWTYWTLEATTLKTLDGTISRALYEFCLQLPNCRVFIRDDCQLATKAVFVTFMGIRQALRGDLDLAFRYPQTLVISTEGIIQRWRSEISNSVERPLLDNLRNTPTSKLDKRLFYAKGTPKALLVLKRKLFGEVQKIFEEGC